MVDDKGGVGGGRVLAQTHAEDIGLESAHHGEIETGGRSIVEHIPSPEDEGVFALGELGYIIIGGATGIGTEVKGEVVVEGVGLCHVAVDDEL